MRAQLVDLAKAVPALAIFAAPGGMLLLPLLAKLLPFNAPAERVGPARGRARGRAGRAADEAAASRPRRAAPAARKARTGCSYRASRRSRVASRRASSFTPGREGAAAVLGDHRVDLLGDARRPRRRASRARRSRTSASTAW